MKIVKFMNWTCEVVEHEYASGGLALRLVDIEDGSAIATATVNMPEYELAEGEILLKGWSENEGLPEALERAGIVELTGRAVANGFVQAPIARYLGNIR